MQTHSKVRQLVEHKADRCEPGCLLHPGKINAETSQTAFREAERSCCGLLLLAQTPVRLRTAPPFPRKKNHKKECEMLSLICLHCYHS